DFTGLSLSSVRSNSFRIAFLTTSSIRSLRQPNASWNDRRKIVQWNALETNRSVSRRTRAGDRRGRRRAGHVLLWSSRGRSLEDDRWPRKLDSASRQTTDYFDRSDR